MDTNQDKLTDEVVWLEAWKAYTRANWSTQTVYASDCVNAADVCLQEFKERFRNETKT